MDEAPPPERQTGRAIARREFEQVIRRAAELAAREGDADELLSEEEVLRIGQELGLSGQLVQRAMYELPELAAQPQWYDRYFGLPVFSTTRVVPSLKDTTMRRLQDYLITREYLQVVRRRGDSVSFIPADDTISSLARAFTRSGNRHMIARASRVMLSVQPLPDDRSHVRFDVDLSQDRREKFRAAMAIGGMGGITLGTIAAHVAGGMTPAVLGPLPEIVAFGGTLLAVGAATISTAARRFRNRVAAARFELAGLLDRVEHGESLEPPPAPWRRRLQLRVFGR